jgi:hypothetical protein
VRGSECGVSPLSLLLRSGAHCNYTVFLFKDLLPPTATAAVAAALSALGMGQGCRRRPSGEEEEL